METKTEREGEHFLQGWHPRHSHIFKQEESACHPWLFLFTGWSVVI